MVMKAKVSIKGNRGSWRVFVKDRYGEVLYSGRVHKLKSSALKEKRRAERWVR